MPFTLQWNNRNILSFTLQFPSNNTFTPKTFSNLLLLQLSPLCLTWFVTGLGFWHSDTSDGLHIFKLTEQSNLLVLGGHGHSWYHPAAHNSSSVPGTNASSPCCQRSPGRTRESSTTVHTYPTSMCSGNQSIFAENKWIGALWRAEKQPGTAHPHSLNGADTKALNVPRAPWTNPEGKPQHLEKVWHPREQLSARWL